jgi:stage II sporulation protein D
VICQRDSHTERIDLEQYLISVVAAYVPDSYEAEMYKVMAVLFRTHIRKVFLGEAEDTTEIMEEKIQLSAYTLEEMRTLWQEDFTSEYEAIRKAVSDTEGEVLLYQGELIEPFFHECSAGKTRTLGGYPYLKAADSSQDSRAENYLTMVVLTREELAEAVRAAEGADIVIGESYEDAIRTESSDGLYVSHVSMDVASGETFSMSGERFAKILGLPSPAFSIETYNGKCRILCRGNGSGLGLSLYGADQLALEGVNYREILSRYYQIQLQSGE